MGVEIQQDGARAVIKLRGNLIATLVQDLRGQLRNLLAEGCREVVFDLSGTQIVDSLGIGLFIMCHNSLQKDGGRMEVTNTSPELLEEFRRMRLERHFPISSAT